MGAIVSCFKELHVCLDFAQVCSRQLLSYIQIVASFYRMVIFAHKQQMLEVHLGSISHTELSVLAALNLCKRLNFTRFL